FTVHLRTSQVPGFSSLHAALLNRHKTAKPRWLQHQLRQRQGTGRTLASFALSSCFLLEDHILLGAPKPRSRGKKWSPDEGHPSPRAHPPPQGSAEGWAAASLRVVRYHQNQANPLQA